MNELTKIALAGIFLGIVSVMSIRLMLSPVLTPIFSSSSLTEFTLGCYLFCTMPMFHLTEFIIAAEYRPHDACFRSFMLFHSPAYLMAMMAAWVEISLSMLGWHPLRDTSSSLSTLIATVFGTMCCLGFYSIRAGAMIHCGNNFSLLVEYSKRNEHILVTTGLYQFLRHPSYFGWFWHSISTQVIVMNPVCFVLFCAANWMFFKSRIREEEELLRSEKFFGKKYDEYCKSSYIGIPFI